MADIIRLLPDSVANQIAAGEVIQRPASVVKELLENSVDAGAAEVRVLIKDSGKTLVQVIDDGCGMSGTDARMAFERHATSKISKAEDLYAIRTMGFRGEALASVAAVAQVEVRSRRAEDEVGTCIEVHGSVLVKHEPVASERGTSVSVKNLFYNTPARRKFLKTDSTELKQIIGEFQRIALANFDLRFSLYHNQTEIYNLPPAALMQRIIGIFGKGMNQHLVRLDTGTSIISIGGFLGKPELARKTYGEQFFFVNRRFMRHAYLHKAVSEAYQPVLPQDAVPSYFIFLEADPANIDVNIHPTKSEVKFEDERAVWQILHASVREALGKFNLAPSLDFDREGVPEIPVFSRSAPVNVPQIDTDASFNPFTTFEGKYRRESPPREWEKLYEGLRGSGSPVFPEKGAEGTESGSQLRGRQFFHFKGRFIITAVKSGLLGIDHKRAHERILFEQFMASMERKTEPSQKKLFPSVIQMDAADHTLLMEMKDNLQQVGFEIRDLGNFNVLVEGLPGEADKLNPRHAIERMLEEFKTTGNDPSVGRQENVARSLAVSAAIPYGKTLSPAEMENLVDRLFACAAPNYSPSGKTVVFILPLEEVEKWF